MRWCRRPRASAWCVSPGRSTRTSRSPALHNPRMRALFTTFSLRELRHHPWRNAAAVLAVMLGVALAFSVHLINASALDEFSSAVRAAGGQPDLELRAVQGSLDENLFSQVATHEQVAFASPVLEVGTQVLGTRG